VGGKESGGGPPGNQQYSSGNAKANIYGLGVEKEKAKKNRLTWSQGNIATDTSKLSPGGTASALKEKGGTETVKDVVHLITSKNSPVCQSGTGAGNTSGGMSSNQRRRKGRGGIRKGSEKKRKRTVSCGTKKFSGRNYRGGNVEMRIVAGKHRDELKILGYRVR